MHSNIPATRMHNWNLDQHSSDEAMWWHYQFGLSLLALNLASDNTISGVVAVCDVYNINNK